MTHTTLQRRRILLAVTGCAQAEYTPRMVSSLLQHPDVGAQDVIVAATPSALHFFERSEVEKKIGRKIFVDHKDSSIDFPVPHIGLGEWADLLIVYPASANTIAKCAHGLCDTLVSTVILAAKCPVYFGPCMNDAMFEKPVTQRNLRLLEEAGYKLIPREVANVFIHATGKTIEKMFCTEAMVLSICQEGSN